MSLRVPAMVALLMLVISAVISERVLDRLSRTQEDYIEGLAETYFDGLSSSVIPAVLREDIWEVFDTLDRSSSLYAAIRPTETVITGTDGIVLAASDPARISSFSKLPADYLARYRNRAITIDTATGQGFARRDLMYQGHKIGTIHTTFDVSRFIAERWDVLVSLLITNSVLALLFAFFGFLIVRQMIGPMRTLEFHMRSASHGTPELIPPTRFPRSDGEVADLFRGYNALVNAERERANFAVQLAEEEKLSSLGRLASGMAHEINNPLGGLFNAIDTLKKHGDTPGVRETSISLIERGLAGIREVVEAALATYRPERSSPPLKPDDLKDIRLLIRPELRRKRQRLDWDIDWRPSAYANVPGGPVRQSVLNLLLNASAATPEEGKISFSARTDADGSLCLEISDSGPGMPTHIASVLTDDDPGPAVRAGRGLGLWMVRQMIDDLGGRIFVDRKPSGGTLVRLLIPVGIKENSVHAI